MKAHFHSNQGPNPQSSRGFTLVELLVVVVIIIALAAVSFTITQSARRSAAKVADMNNLRSLSAAAMAAGSDNAGRLPQIHAGAQTGNSNSAPYWLVANTVLESYGIFREGSYAPGRNITGGAPKYDWWTKHQPGTPVHYSYLANDSNPATNDAWFLKGTVKVPDRSEYRGSIPYDEIIKDRTKAFAKNTTDDAWYPLLWASLCRDWPGSARVAAIMNNGDALGVNVMFLDGHCEWIPKKKMRERYSTSGGLKILW
jgi:prepilin-type N-terminal cleavage/methylation domain-containing protein/prepilin-type processing-associated H-X9-DG protein